MILIYNDKEYANYGCIMEDIDPNKRRIFINRTGLDITTLATRFGEFFKGQDASDRYSLTIGDNFRNEAPIQTAGKWAWGFNSATRGNVAAMPGHQDPWFASLDYENVPGKRSFKTPSGLMVYQIYSNYATTDGTSDFWVGTDMAGPADFYSQANVNFVTVFGEEAFNDSVWGISYDNGTYLVGRLTITKAAVTWATQRSQTVGQFFYLGKNMDGSVIFIQHDGTTNQLLGFTHTGSLATSTPIQSFTGSVLSAATTHYQFPSNVWHKSDVEKVFYQGQYDGNSAQELKILGIAKYVWNPYDGSITQTMCNVVYPQGKTYLDYHTMMTYTSGNHSALSNAWFYKMHFFKSGGVKYLTYLYIDKSGPNLWSERAHVDKQYFQSRWITYSISDDGNTLTYHSSFEFPLKREIPTYYLPYNSSGTMLLVTTSDSLNCLAFSPASGWYIADSEQFAVRSIGIDSVGRVYATTRFSTFDVGDTNTDGKGYNSTYQYIPPNPVSAEVTTSASEYTYTGSPISIMLNVNVYDVDGNRVALAVTLGINGNNLTFNDGSTVKTITTSSTGNTQVEALIIGAGVPSIIATVIG